MKEDKTIEDFLKGDFSCRVGDWCLNIENRLFYYPSHWLWNYLVFKKEWFYLTKDEQRQLEGKKLHALLRGRVRCGIGIFILEVARSLAAPFWWLWNRFTFKREYSQLTDKERKDIRDRTFEESARRLKRELKKKD